MTRVLPVSRNPRRPLLIGVAAVLGCVLLYGLITVGGALLSIRSSVQAMRPAAPAPLAAGSGPAASLGAGAAQVIGADAPSGNSARPDQPRADAPSGARARAEPTSVPSEPTPTAAVVPTLALSQLAAAAPPSLRSGAALAKTAQPTVTRAPAPTRTDAACCVQTITPVPLGAGDAPIGTPPLRPISTIAPDSVAARAPPAGDAINILLLGVDRRPDEQGQPARADSIILVRVEPSRQRVALLSFPRDLIVNIPGYGYSRINAAHSYGDTYPELGGGLELSRKTVSDLTGQRIDYVASVDFMGFIAAVDAIGGVEINVEKEIYDPSYPTMDYGYQEVYFAPGVQQMDGDTALKYARTRHADSDWERARRQQQVITAIGQKVRGQGYVGQVQTLAKLLDSLKGYIVTDLPEDRMLGLAWAFRTLKPESVERYVLDENHVSMGAPGDPYAEYALPGAVEELVNQWMGGP